METMEAKILKSDKKGGIEQNQPKTCKILTFRKHFWQQFV